MVDRTILGIAGSLRAASYNRSSLRAAQDLQPFGWRIDIFDLEGVPPFCQDDEEEPPPAVIALKERIRAAHAILFATPEYNYSISGVLKNAIDWASRPLGDNAWRYKPVAIMGASLSVFGTVRAQFHLRQICISLDMRPLNHPEVSISEAADKFEAGGTLVDIRSRDRIAALVTSLAAWTDRLSGSAASPRL